MSRIKEGTFAHLALLCQKRKSLVVLELLLRQRLTIMDIQIKYNDIINRCEQLSSFEADGKFDANGESRYLEIHINEVDKMLITDYIKQAQAIIEERIARMITNVEDVKEGFTWSIRTDSRWSGVKSFTKHVTEAIVAYAMASWLKGRLDERVAFYEELFNNTLAMAVKNIFTKQAPKK